MALHLPQQPTEKAFLVNLHVKTGAMEFLVLSFYYYTKLPQAETFAAEHLEHCRQQGIRGRILVADEGVNGTVSAPVAVAEEYMDFMRSLPYFPNIEFKVHPHPEHAFDKLHVRYRPEIVNSGLATQPDVDPTQQTGKHLEPEEFQQLKDREDVVVLDVRSNYETSLGRFKNAVVLDLENFREFPEKVDELEALKNKKVITYCTGGIKCEKASAYLLKKGFKDVYQLHGGILNYGQKAGGKDFEGECYVFDKRISVPINSVNPKVISRCMHCQQETSRMLNCANPHCNDQVVMCENCSWEWEGTCSAECKEHPEKRLYDGTGDYSKRKMHELRTQGAVK